jgi:DNA-directed RNA polymerase subunit RPC12/RpoP
MSVPNTALKTVNRKGTAMSISLHCESCKKKIKAPDATGGKWGKCPHCGHRCYIPLPKSNDEPELVLMPLDESDETQIAELMRETKDLTKEILTQIALPEDDPVAAASTRISNEKEIIKYCILYLRQMADGELAAAEHTFSQLKKYKKPVLRTLASMARAEQPEPELADLPPTILQGLIRDVSTKLS